MRLTVRWLLLFFWVPLFAKAQSYHWPVSASKFLTSSFCEYRPRHYHAAIDIKTWNREGYTCFAVEDGYIWRIRLSPFGYGKALYLKLKDGRFAVYGHLQRYTSIIDSMVRRLQLKKQRYSIDWYPKNLKVKKGEIIAYSGQTGIGYPHLHLEIRDAENHPLNPLFFFGEQVKDDISPILQELLIVPLTGQSRVNGSALAQSFPVKKKGKNLYTIEEPLYLQGKVGFALRAYDLANGVFNRLSYYRASLFIDDQLVFKIHFDTLDFDLTGQIDLEYHYPSLKSEGKRFRTLYRLPYNRLPFYKDSPGNGILQTAPGKHSFRIVAEDFHGNRSILEGEFFQQETFRFGLDLVQHFGKRIFLKILLPIQTQYFYFYARTGERWQPLEYFEILRHATKDRVKFYLIRIDLPDTTISTLRLVAKLHAENPIQAEINLNGATKPKEFRLINQGKGWLFQAWPMTYQEKLRLHIRHNQESYSLLPQIRDGLLQEFIPVGSGAENRLQIKLVNDQEVLFDSSFVYHVFFPGKENEYSFDDAHLSLQSSRWTVYDTLAFVLESEVFSLPEVPTLSPILGFNNHVQPLRQSLFATIRYDSVSVPAHCIGLYSLDGNELEYIGGRVDSSQKECRVFIPDLSTRYLLLADTVPPQVQILKPEKNAPLKESVSVKIKLFDSLSGIGSDDNIDIRIDGKWLIPEWDPERKTVIARPHWQLAPGMHKLHVTVKDRAGNIYNEHIQFQSQ